MRDIANKQTYIQIGHECRQATVKNLRALCGPFSLTEWSGRAFNAMWPDTFFPWTRIDKQVTAIDRLETAIWHESRLVGMGVARGFEDGILLEFIEGDRRDGCPLKRSRTLIFLDAATNYAQIRDLHRLYVQPMGSGLVNYYKKFGFKDPDPRSGSPYMWKEV